jgi:hypothetical protein
VDTAGDDGGQKEEIVNLNNRRMSAIKGNVALLRKRTGSDGLGKGSSDASEKGVMAVGLRGLEELNEMLAKTIEMALEKPVAR